MSENVSRRTFVAGAAATAAAAAVATTPLAMAAEGAGYTPGTYTADAMGVGIVTVQLTVDESSVTDAMVDVSGESSMVGRVAGDADQVRDRGRAGGGLRRHQRAHAHREPPHRRHVPAASRRPGTRSPPRARTLDDQSAEDWLGTEPTIAEDKITETIDTDIVIVGAGNGGMAAAAYAAEHGLNFHVVEKYAERAGHAPLVRRRGLPRRQGGRLRADEPQEAALRDQPLRVRQDQPARRQAVDQRVRGHVRLVVKGVVESDPYNYKALSPSPPVRAHWPDELQRENTVYMFPERAEEHYIGE